MVRPNEWNSTKPLCIYFNTCGIVWLCHFFHDLEFLYLISSSLVNIISPLYRHLYIYNLQIRFSLQTNPKFNWFSIISSILRNFRYIICVYTYNIFMYMYIYIYICKYMYVYVILGIYMYVYMYIYLYCCVKTIYLRIFLLRIMNTLMNCIEIQYPYKWFFFIPENLSSNLWTWRDDHSHLDNNTLIIKKRIFMMHNTNPTQKEPHI